MPRLEPEHLRLCQSAALVARVTSPPKLLLPKNPLRAPQSEKARKQRRALRLEHRVRPRENHHHVRHERLRRKLYLHVLQGRLRRLREQ